MDGETPKKTSFTYELTEDQQRKLAEKYLNEVGKPDEH